MPSHCGHPMEEHPFADVWICIHCGWWVFMDGTWDADKEAAVV